MDDYTRGRRWDWQSIMRAYTEYTQRQGMRAGLEPGYHYFDGYGIAHDDYIYNILSHSVRPGDALVFGDDKRSDDADSIYAMRDTRIKLLLKDEQRARKRLKFARNEYEKMSIYRDINDIRMKIRKIKMENLDLDRRDDALAKSIGGFLEEFIPE